MTSYRRCLASLCVLSVGLFSFFLCVDSASAQPRHRSTDLFGDSGDTARPQYQHPSNRAMNNYFEQSRQLNNNMWNQLRQDIERNQRFYGPTTPQWQQPSNDRPEREPRQPPRFRQRQTEPQPQRYIQPQSYRPQPYQQPLPQSRPPVQTAPRVQPKPNTVVVRKVPKSNTNPVLQLANLTDAGDVIVDEQVRIADELGAEMDDHIADLLDPSAGDSGFPDPNKDPAIHHEWKNLVKRGADPEDLEDFLQNHGVNLPPDVVDQIQTRIEVAKYQDSLSRGDLQQWQQEDVLSDLSSLASRLNQTWIDDRIQTLQNLNLIGQLTETIPPTMDSFDVIVQGVHHADLPISLVSRMTHMPIYDAAPIADVPTPPVADTASSTKSVIHNPEKNGMEVNFTLDGKHQTLQPGSEMKLSNSQIVEFDNGQGKNIRYRVSEGTYSWAFDETQWNLYKSKVKVVFDNSAYDGEFHYLVDNQNQTLSAGDLVEHSSTLPITLSFDRGDGTTTRKELKSGTYRIGVDADKQRLDLFAEADVQEPADSPFASFAQEGRSRTPAPKRRRVNDLLERLKTESKRTTQPAPALLTTDGA